MLDLLDELARLCGTTALRHFRKGVAVELKADGSEVTAADREAEMVVRNWVEKRFPDDTILGEEFGTSGGGGKRRWLVDPIDGTRSFVHGVPLWGSMIAVEEDGVVIAGAINCAAVGELVVASRGEGCWHNGARASVSGVSAVSDATILCTDSWFRRNPHRTSRWMDLCRVTGCARTWGDCFGYLMVATGRAELMVDDRLSPWDAFPLVPIIEEAGGVFTDWRGRGGPGDDAVATNVALATSFRDALGVPELAT